MLCYQNKNWKYTYIQHLIEKFEFYLSVCSDRLQPEAVKFSVSMLLGESNQPSAATFITPVLPHGLYAILQNDNKTQN